MKHIKFISFILIIAATISSCNKTKETDSPIINTAVEVGSKAPDFSIADLDGNIHKLSDYKGSYVVVDFWAAWCGICRNENPKMQALHEKYRAQNLQIIGISLDETKQAWSEAVTKDGLSYIQLGDQQAFDSEVAKTYGISGIPFMMLVDPEGIIITLSNRVENIEAEVEKLF